MRRHLRRSRFAARPSSANGGSSIALLPTAWRKQETACSPSCACHRANGAASAQRMRSSGCTKSSNAGSKPRPCCRRPTRPRCCSGRCWPRDRSACARGMAGRRSPQNPLISRLTSPPETLPSCYPGIRHTEFQPHSGRHQARPAPHSDAGVSELWIILDRILADHFRLDRLLPRIASSLCPFLPRRVLPSKPIASVLRVCSCSPLGSLRLPSDLPPFPPPPFPPFHAP